MGCWMEKRIIATGAAVRQPNADRHVVGAASPPNAFTAFNVSSVEGGASDAAAGLW